MPVESWSPEHRAAYEATIAAKRAARARGEPTPPRANTPLTDEERHSAAEAMDRALGGLNLEPKVERTEAGQPKDKRCLCTHIHWRGQPTLPGKRRPDLGCSEKGCPCPGWRRRAPGDEVRWAAREPQGPKERDVPAPVAHPDPDVALSALVGALREALELAGTRDGRVLERVESIRQTVLRLEGRTATAANKALVPVIDATWRGQVEEALVRILRDQRRHGETLDAMVRELRRVASRPAVIREFRPDHRRTADGGHPVGRQRRKAGVGRAPRVVEPTAQAG